MKTKLSESGKAIIFFSDHLTTQNEKKKLWFFSYHFKNILLKTLLHSFTENTFKVEVIFKLI